MLEKNRKISVLEYIACVFRDQSHMIVDKKTDKLELNLVYYEI